MGRRQTKERKTERPDYKPTEADNALMQEFFDRREHRAPAPRVKIDRTSSGKIAIGPDHPEPTVWHAGLHHAFGTASEDFIQTLSNQLCNVVLQSSEGSPDEGQFNGLLAAMYGIGPRDEIEAMLAAQMVACQSAAMECLRRANLAGQTFEGRDMALKHATKLMRTYTAQMEALNRHRGKGQQKVTVEHVHVHKGGQAIVGNVQGGGVTAKSEGQPDGQALTYAPGTTLPCQDEAGNALPVSGGERETTLPDARRGERKRRAEGQ